MKTGLRIRRITFKKRAETMDTDERFAASQLIKFQSIANDCYFASKPPKPPTFEARNVWVAVYQGECAIGR